MRRRFGSARTSNVVVAMRSNRPALTMIESVKRVCWAAPTVAAPSSSR